MWSPLGYRTFPSPSRATEPPRRPANPPGGGDEVPDDSPSPPAALPPARLPAPVRGAVRARRAGPSVPRSRPVQPAHGAGARASTRLLQGPGASERAPPTGAVSCSCPRHLRWVTARVTGRGEGGCTASAGGGSLGSGSHCRPPPPPRGAPSEGRAAAGAARSLPPSLTCCAGLQPASPRLPPAGWGCPSGRGRGARPLPSGRRQGAAARRGERQGMRGSCGDVTCQRARRTRARRSRGREEVPGCSGRQFPRKNLPHSLNVNDSKRGVLPLH